MEAICAVANLYRESNGSSTPVFEDVLYIKLDSLSAQGIEFLKKMCDASVGKGNTKINYQRQGQKGNLATDLPSSSSMDFLQQ